MCCLCCLSLCVVFVCVRSVCVFGVIVWCVVCVCVQWVRCAAWVTTVCVCVHRCQCCVCLCCGGGCTTHALEHMHHDITVAKMAFVAQKKIALCGKERHTTVLCKAPGINGKREWFCSMCKNFECLDHVEVHNLR